MNLLEVSLTLNGEPIIVDLSCSLLEQHRVGARFASNCYDVPPPRIQENLRPLQFAYVTGSRLYEKMRSKSLDELPARLRVNPLPSQPLLSNQTNSHHYHRRLNHPL